MPNLSAGVPAPGTHENRRCEAILVRMLYPATFVGTRIAVRVSRMRCSVERVARNGAPLIRDPGFFFLFPVCGSQAASTQSRLTRLCALKMPISGKLEIGVCSAPFASLMLRCARDTLVGFLLSLWLRSATSCIALTPPSAQHPSFPRRLFRPGYDHSFLLPHDGSEAPRGARVQRHPQKHAVTPRAQALARRLASRPRDTASLGAPPWRFSAGVRASFAGISSGSVQRAPRSQVVVPGGRGPGPPEATVASRRRRTPLPAPPSGSPPETPLDERGCESIYYGCLS